MCLHLWNPRCLCFALVGVKHFSRFHHILPAGWPISHLKFWVSQHIFDMLHYIRPSQSNVRGALYLISALIFFLHLISILQLQGGLQRGEKAWGEEQHRCHRLHLLQSTMSWPLWNVPVPTQGLQNTKSAPMLFCNRNVCGFKGL